MPGPWTEERRAKAREHALKVQPWLKSTGPRTEAGKAKVSRNAYRGGLRPLRREARRECKASAKALDKLAAWLEMEDRIDAWLEELAAAGEVPTTKAMRQAGLRELRPPCTAAAEVIAEVLR